MPSPPNPRRLAAVCVLRHLASKPIAGRLWHVAPAIISLAETLAPRTGRWYEDGCSVEISPHGERTFIVEDLCLQRGDGRALSQAETDALIQVDLHRTIAPWGIRDGTSFLDFCAWPSVPGDWNPPISMFLATSQRGGIHTRVEVRALALACWGDRDTGKPRAS